MRGLLSMMKMNVLALLRLISVGPLHSHGKPVSHFIVKIADHLIIVILMFNTDSQCYS